MPGYERLVAEVYFEQKFLAQISQERGEGEFDIETPGVDLVERLVVRRVDLAGFQGAVAVACQRLKGEDVGRWQAEVDGRRFEIAVEQAREEFGVPSEAWREVE